MTIDIKKMREAWDNDRIGTHWGDCIYSHRDCAIFALCAELEQARARVAELRRLPADSYPSSDFLLSNISPKRGRSGRS